MILLIDNYDSFSYNLYQMMGMITPDIEVVRNDALTAGEIRAKKPAAIVLSPGPGRPADAGVCEEAIRVLGGEIPVLGVCLGHQAICEAFGASIVHAAELMHGKQSLITVDPACPLFAGLEEAVPAARYHSLAVKEDTLPPELAVTARAQDEEIMAVQHRTEPVFGVQFHPESIMTPDGLRMLKNFVDFVNAFHA